MREVGVDPHVGEPLAPEDTIGAREHVGYDRQERRSEQQLPDLHALDAQRLYGRRARNPGHECQVVGERQVE